MQFKDRRHAGQALARALASHLKTGECIVLALPRGGVPVAMEVASALKAPLDVVLIRKLGHPTNPEYAFGAVGLDNIPHINAPKPNLSNEEILQIQRKEYNELTRRNKVYRQGRPFPNLNGKTVVLIDDGIATGATLIAALHNIQQCNPASVIVAVPVAPADAIELIKQMGPTVVCLQTPEYFNAVGQWYESFPQVSDQEVVELLKTKP